MTQNAGLSARSNGFVMLPNGREGIELTDDVHNDEPTAWMVLMHNTTIYEYKVFTAEHEAIDCAADQAEESGMDWKVYPLYPTHGLDAT